MITHTQYETMVSAAKKDFIPTLEEIQQINSFMLCRWMANGLYSVEFGNFINCNTDMPINVQYWFARSAMNGVEYNKRLEKENKLTPFQEIISKHYSVSFDIAKTYEKLMTDEQKRELEKKYQIGGRVK